MAVPYVFLGKPMGRSGVVGLDCIDDALMLFPGGLDVVWVVRGKTEADEAIERFDEHKLDGGEATIVSQIGDREVKRAIVVDIGAFIGFRAVKATE